MSILNNPHYKPSAKQLAELHTQEVRNDDVYITAPIVRRKSKNNKPKARLEDERNNTSRDQVSTPVVHTKVQKATDVS